MLPMDQAPSGASFRLTYNGPVGVAGTNVTQTWDLTRLRSDVRESETFKESLLILVRQGSAGLTAVSAVVDFVDDADGVPVALKLTVTAGAIADVIALDVWFLYSPLGAVCTESQLYFVKTFSATSGGTWTTGNGLPEGVVVGKVGDLWTQLDAVGGPTLWSKQSGIGNTGWGALVPMNAEATIIGQMFLGMTAAGAVPTGKLHASNAGMQYSTDVSNRAQLRFNAYGNVAGNAPGLTTFRSRGLTLGSLLPVVVGDILGRWTAIGVSDNLSINLAAFLSFYADAVPPGGAFVQTRAELELVDTTNVRRLAVKVTPNGELSARGPIGPGNGAAGAANAGPRWRTNAGSPEGVMVGSPGDLYTNTNGGVGTTLYVKESGVATNTGWVAK